MFQELTGSILQEAVESFAKDGFEVTAKVYSDQAPFFRKGFILMNDNVEYVLTENQIIKLDTPYALHYACDEAGLTVTAETVEDYAIFVCRQLWRLKQVPFIVVDQNVKVIDPDGQQVDVPAPRTLSLKMGKDGGLEKAVVEVCAVHQESIVEIQLVIDRDGHVLALDKMHAYTG